MDLLPAKLFEILERAGLSTPKQILVMSSSEMKKNTNLNCDDIILIKNIIAKHYCVQSATGDILLDSQSTKVSTGCSVIDKLLSGGLRRGTLTELYGESGSGKTQVALQAALNNWETGTVYICTEDLFPLKRFNQIKTGLQSYCSDIDYGKNIFVEHVTEAHELLACIKVRLPRLLLNQQVSLIVIDSVAAPFRTDNTNYIQRAEELRELAICLMKLAQEYNFAVLCINQVTSSFDDVEENVIASLGLAWSNMLSARISIRKSRIIDSKRTDRRIITHLDSFLPLQVRELTVNFAPDIANLKAEIVVTSKKIIGIDL